MRASRWALIATTVMALAACGAPREATGPAEAKDAVEALATPVESQARGMLLNDPWIAVTPPGAKAAAGFVEIVNPTEIADRLVAAASPRAASVEIHEMVEKDGMMSMRPAAGGLALAAGGAATLAPGGTHLMFMGPTAPFVAGETVPVTLTFEKAGKVEATFAVRPRDAAAKADDHGQGGGAAPKH